MSPLAHVNHSGESPGGSAADGSRTARAAEQLRGDRQRAAWLSNGSKLMGFFRVSCPEI